MAVDALLSANCGFSSDLSGPITDRAFEAADGVFITDEGHHILELKADEVVDYNFIV